MIKQLTILLNLIVLITLCGCYEKNDNAPQTGERKSPSETDNQPQAGNPVLHLLTELMDKKSHKTAPMANLQKQFETSISHIQKIPRKNEAERNRLEMEKKKHDLEKQLELEENIIQNSNYNIYGYKNSPSISYSVGKECISATCLADGKPFAKIQNYCVNGIHDLEAACSKKFSSSRARRDYDSEPNSGIAQGLNVQPGAIKSCIPKTSWKEDCNRCVCLEEGLPACTRMLCPPLSESQSAMETHGNASENSPRLKRTTNAGSVDSPADKVNDDDDPNQMNDSDLPNSIDHQCIPGFHWEEGCNSCYCTPDGLGKYCTANMCMDTDSNFVTEKWQVCTPGYVWTEECDHCTCTSANGFSCTGPGLAICLQNSTWTIDCNKCSCSKTGSPICTHFLCSGTNNINNEPIELYAPKRHACIEGKVFSTSCKQCRCAEDGNSFNCNLVNY